LVSD
jgi:Icc-related predicted phosphoesterase